MHVSLEHFWLSTATNGLLSPVQVSSVQARFKIPTHDKEETITQLKDGGERKKKLPKLWTVLIMLTAKQWNTNNCVSTNPSCQGYLFYYATRSPLLQTELINRIAAKGVHPLLNKASMAHSYFSILDFVYK